MMLRTCPKCGWRDLHLCRRKTAAESVLRLIGVTRWRCRSCARQSYLFRARPEVLADVDNTVLKPGAAQR